jgi:hypothetical protein
MFVSPLDRIAEGFMTLMDAAPPPWAWLVLFFLTEPLHALIHELGHGAAALALRPGRVAVAIGRRPPLVVWRLGRMTISFHLLMPLWRNHADCTHEAEGSRGEAALIALAGPAASLLTCIVAWSALVRVGSGLLHDLLFAMTFISFISAVGNLVPLTVTDYRGTRRRTDGAVIVAALR